MKAVLFMAVYGVVVGLVVISAYFAGVAVERSAHNTPQLNAALLELVGALKAVPACLPVGHAVGGEDKAQRYSQHSKGQ